ncbi:MAG: NAD-binding protein, partial [Halobacteriota archaeon]
TKLFTLSFIIFGTAAFTAAIGSLLIPAIESRMAAAVGNMTPSELKLLEDHVLVLGYGDLTEPVIAELEGQVDLVVVTPDASDATMLRDRGISVLTADPTDTESLREANIELARGVVVATEDDAQDVLAIIAVEQTNPDVFVVAAANRRQHVDKLRLVGADEVISPTVITGQVIGRSVLEGARLSPEEAREASGDEA